MNKKPDRSAGKWPAGGGFQQMTVEGLTKILGLTIKRDEVNKAITFLCGLSTFTDSCQFNISFNAPSSSGKSFIPIELSSLFPPEDVMRIGSCSPTAFYHEQGAYDKASNTIRVDLSRKLIVFIEMPNNGLLERLRPMLSHDMPEIASKITDKSEKGGNRTKTVIIRGFPAVVFCTAGLNIDEQELTRFILLSPEINQEKLRESVRERINRESDPLAYKEALSRDPDRQALMRRIVAIRDAGITEVNLASPELIEKQFLESRPILKPKHMRDIGKIMNIAKSLALLNLWWRKREGNTLFANEEDAQNALDLWHEISVSQELGIPPYIYSFYSEVIWPTWKDRLALAGRSKPRGLTTQEVRDRHFLLRETMLNDFKLRTEILPMLESAGLIMREQSPDDSRLKLIIPLSDAGRSGEI